jgi:uncharacterized protein YjiS (DUF1127 family)
MQRFTPRVSAIAAATGDFSTPAFARPKLTQALRAGTSAALAAAARTMRAWRERARERRELAMLSPRDLYDIGVSAAAVRAELNRWPWQASTLSTVAEQLPAPEPKVDAMQCIVFPFTAHPAPARSRRRHSDAA